VPRIAAFPLFQAQVGFSAIADRAKQLKIFRAITSRRRSISWFEGDDVVNVKPPLFSGDLKRCPASSAQPALVIEKCSNIGRTVLSGGTLQASLTVARMLSDLFRVGPFPLSTTFICSFPIRSVPKSGPGRRDFSRFSPDGTLLFALFLRAHGWLAGGLGRLWGLRWFWRTACFDLRSFPCLAGADAVAQFFRILGSPLPPIRGHLLGVFGSPLFHCLPGAFLVGGIPLGRICSVCSGAAAVVFANLFRVSGFPAALIFADFLAVLTGVFPLMIALRLTFFVWHPL